LSYLTHRNRSHRTENAAIDGRGISFVSIQPSIAINAAYSGLRGWLLDDALPFFSRPPQDTSHE